MKKAYTRISLLQCAIGCAGLALASGAARADQVRISYDLAQGSGNGFGYSLLHTTTNDRGNGSLLYRVEGTFQVIFDDVAQTLEFVQFDADLVSTSNSSVKFGEISLRANSLIDLSTGTEGPNDFLVGADDGDQSGNGSLLLSLTDTSGSIQDGFEGDRDFLFLAHDYAMAANHFDAVSYAIGLWGATTEVFGGDGHGGNTDIDSDSLGVDILGVVTAVPLPTPAGLAFCGIAGVGAFRRRR